MLLFLVIGMDDCTELNLQVVYFFLLVAFVSLAVGSQGNAITLAVNGCQTNTFHWGLKAVKEIVFTLKALIIILAGTCPQGKLFSWQLIHFLGTLENLWWPVFLGE